MTTAAIIAILFLLIAAFYFLFRTKAGAPSSDEDARRFARLLVTEIKLYENKKIEQGLKNDNLYEVLFERIEEARKIYNQRVASAENERFFDEALIEILANGDRSKLGQKGSSTN